MPGHVFISYVRENQEVVDRLARDLRARGVAVWLDRDEIRPGQRWRDAIRDAIGAGALFVACFSREYAQRDSTYMNEELTLAIEELRRRPTTRAWFIPAIIGDGEVPNRTIGAGETLRDLQWLDLERNWPQAIEWLVESAGGASLSGWTGISGRLERIFRAPLAVVLGTGKLPIPDYLARDTMVALVQSCTKSVEAVSHDDLRFWRRADPDAERYWQENINAVRRGVAVTRVFVLPRVHLLYDDGLVTSVMRLHLTADIGFAIVIREDLGKRQMRLARDYVLFDESQALTTFRRQEPRLQLSIDSDDQPRGRATIRLHQRVFSQLISFCSLASQPFAVRYRLTTAVTKSDVVADLEELERGIRTLKRRCESAMRL